MFFFVFAVSEIVSSAVIGGKGLSAFNVDKDTRTARSKAAAGIGFTGQEYIFAALFGYASEVFGGG